MCEFYQISIWAENLYFQVLFVTLNIDNIYLKPRLNVKLKFSNVGCNPVVGDVLFLRNLFNTTNQTTA